MGINPKTLQGEIVFSTNKGAIREVCELVARPEATCVLKASLPPKQVKFASPGDAVKREDTKQLLSSSEKAKRLVALVRSRG